MERLAAHNKELRLGSEDLIKTCEGIRGWRKRMEKEEGKGNENNEKSSPGNNS
jgi:hypothetical protein